MSVETNPFRYFKSDCPHCKGAIEFLERGVVEKVVCPYCAKEIEIPTSPPLSPIKEWLYSRCIPVLTWILLIIALFVHNFLAVICTVFFAVLICVGIPFSVFIPKSRVWVCMGFACWSLMALLELVGLSFQVVSDIWGTGAACAGVLIGCIVGVIPEAMIASLVKGQFNIFWPLVFGVATILTSWYLPLYLGSRKK